MKSYKKAFSEWFFIRIKTGVQNVVSFKNIILSKVLKTGERTSFRIFDVFEYYAKITIYRSRVSESSLPPVPCSNASVIAAPIRSCIEVSNYGTV